MVQWLRLRASSAGAVGSNPDKGTKISHAALLWPKKIFVQKREKKLGPAQPECLLSSNGIWKSLAEGSCFRFDTIFLFFLKKKFLYLAAGTLVVAQGVSDVSHEVFHWHMGTIVTAHRLSCVPCSQWDLTTMTRDQIQVSCNARWIPDHWTTREVLRAFQSIAIKGTSVIFWWS